MAKAYTKAQNPDLHSNIYEIKLLISNGHNPTWTPGFHNYLQSRRNQILPNSESVIRLNLQKVSLQLVFKLELNVMRQTDTK